MFMQNNIETNRKNETIGQPPDVFCLYVYNVYNLPDHNGSRFPGDQDNSILYTYGTMMHELFDTRDLWIPYEIQ